MAKTVKRGRTHDEGFLHGWDAACLAVAEVLRHRAEEREAAGMLSSAVTMGKASIIANAMRMSLTPDQKLRLLRKTK